jgi:hypothetical protein
MARIMAIRKVRMRFFLKSTDIWQIVESSWTPPNTTAAEMSIVQTSARLSNDKALNPVCQALSPSEFSRILHCEIAQEAWAILETTYECTKIVKFAKLQMLVSQQLEKFYGESREENFGCKAH